MDAVDVLVLSTGHHNKLAVSPATRALLASRGIPYLSLNTRDAIAKYNDLVANGHIA